MAKDPNSNMICIAGREVLRLIKYTDHGFEDARNLRIGRTNLNYASVDVDWNPNDSNRFATAATNGNVVVWNAMMSGKNKKIELVISEHASRVNSISWNPFDGNRLLSGSTDSTIRLWDMRDKGSSSVLMNASVAVYDVKWNPNNPYIFASASYNGLVCVWDCRTQNIITTYSGHQRIAQTIDWGTHHSDYNFLASGGADGKIQIWDTGLSTERKPITSIQTIEHVGKIKWRPGCSGNIASSGSLMDTKIYVWDASKPYVPINSVSFHTDACTGIIWIDSDHMITCSKDGQVALHNLLEDGYSPYDSAPKNSLSWGAKGELAHIHNITGPRYEDDIVGIMTTFKPAEDQEIMWSDEDFTYLAKNYKFMDDTIENLCEHNSNVAKSRNKHKIAQFWKVLKLMYTEPEDSSDQFYQEYPEFPKEDYFEEEIGIEDDIVMVRQFNQAKSSMGISSGPKINGFIPLKWSDIDLVIDTLRRLVSGGNIQTPCIVYMILHAMLDIPELEISSWLYYYIDWLRRLELDLIAAEIIKHSPILGIRQFSSKSKFHPVCRCGRGKEDTWICTKCNYTHTCTICHEPVKKSYVYCNGCGHGGHIHHMREWFENNSRCPAGCSHICNENFYN
eukprot:TRINITY_DN1846_c0_g1_i1.p1 TRINITY_DN1846_c0_g1~~TRINITY_DN1846_c0_g1_i1.p1  ORF type:complete len:637 (+),score=97.93 TRINITY_DN1846_c0_g1_i1:54-1913(+)